MEEKEILEGTEPQVHQNSETDKVEATIPNAESDSINKTVTVKFNKEIRELSYDEAATLAQKGMKYESIAEDYTRLKTLAGAHGKGIKEYIDFLEGNQCSNKGLEELMENFPEIKGEEDIPEAVTTAAKETGVSLLDAFLRYRLSEERQANEAKQKEQKNSNTSVGSQRSSGGTLSEINDEFIKGLWD